MDALELKRIEGEFTDKERLKAVNPDYKRGLIYQRNCGNCAVANEMRHQGYDVEALPSVFGMKMEGLAAMFDGAVVQKAPAVSVVAVERKLLTLGENARGAIAGDYKHISSGHLFSFKVHDGKVIFEDGQIGKENVTHLKEMDLLSIEYVRLDNTTPNANVLMAVKNRRVL